MMDDNEDEEFEETKEKTSFTRKKMIIFLLPILIVIGISVGIYFSMNNNFESFGGSYNIVQNGSENVTVIYDIPEIKTVIQDEEVSLSLRMRISLELSSLEDLKAIEAVLSRLTDVIIAHTIELNHNEIEGSTGLYWLKEELLYRINLATHPVKIKNLNFKTFELQPQKEKD